MKYTKHKFGAIRTKDRDGVYHPSKLEAAFYDQYLWPLKQSGIIIAIVKQPSVEIGYEVLTDLDGNPIHKRIIRWKVDYKAVYKDGSVKYYEPKGKETDDYKRRLRMWKKCGPDELVVVKGRCVGGRWAWHQTSYIPENPKPNEANNG